MLDRHHDISLYDGVVRESYKDVVQAGFDPYDKDGAGQNKTNGRALKGKNTTDIQVYGLDSRAHLSALGVTIAVGCSLLMLNVVVFAAIYYQKDKINMAKNVQKAMYQVEKGESEEDQSYKQPYLLKDAPSSLILHEFEPIQSFKEPQPVFDLVIESGDIKPHQASELQADIVPAKPHKVKTVTFCETQPLLIEPPEPFSPGSIKCHEQLAFSPLDPSETDADVNS